MNNVYLSKSRYCKVKQCKKILWLDKYKQEVKTSCAKDAVLKNGTIVEELARGLFGKYTNIEFNSDLSKMILDTKEALKKVLPALYPNAPELDYHNLPIVHNGGEASDTFLSLKGKTKQEQQVLRNGLLVYCKLDTYAMVKVWERLKEIVE